MSSDREREWERERELQQAHYHAREWERQRERERERIREGERDRDRDRERRRSERAGVARPEASQQQYQQLAGREEQVPQRRAKGPGGERVARERSTGERVAVERSTRERERERARESDREGQRERERESGRERRQSTRERSDPARRESRSNPPAPPRPPAAVGGASRRESTRDPDRRHSRRDREAGGSDSRRETVRLVAREADPEAEVDGGGLKRGGTRRNQSQSHRRSQSTRERNRNREHAAGLGAVSGGEAGMDRTKSGRERPHRERSRRERATAPGGYFPVAVPNADADSYDGRQAEMRARYKPVPQDIAPPPPAVAPITVGWDGGGDGTGDLEKGSGGGDKAALLDKRLSTSSGIGSHLKKKSRKKRRCHPCLWVLLLIAILLIIILVPVGVLVVGREKSQDENAQRDAEAKSERESGLDNINRTSIPDEAKGTYYDPFDWYDTKDFNCTYTTEMVGELPVIGLFSEWDDSARANDNIPPLNEPWDYGKQPIRGVNVGGWFVMEPFITPSYFSEWDPSRGVVDEYTLSTELGPQSARKTFEKHYSEFITEDDFRRMRDAGLDHVRIPFGYWAALQLDGDPYVFQVQWRYLLRAIEYCRKYGLRVKLDLHGVPGGANGWNHSGRLGAINWLFGKDGDKNGQLTLDLHDRLSKFFSQPRYKNVITLYGLVNEPRMTFLDANKVNKWTRKAYDIVRRNGYEGKIVFGDGFRGLEKWEGEFTDLDGMVLDVHQYVIFNTGQISLTHAVKVKLACQGWSTQVGSSNDPKVGFGPTMVGEWGQADTDCTPYLNNVGLGTRWEGTLKYSDDDPGNVLTPSCPNELQCSCEKSNEHPDKYSDEYRLFLKTFAIAQMDAFEYGWGWMYWTWQTEDAHQWSYRKGLEAGILPESAVNRGWNCGDEVPDFAAMGLPESY